MVWSAEPFASAPQRSVRARPNTTRASTPMCSAALIAFACCPLSALALVACRMTHRTPVVRRGAFAQHGGAQTRGAGFRGLQPEAPRRG